MIYKGLERVSFQYVWGKKPADYVLRLEGQPQHFINDAVLFDYRIISTLVEQKKKITLSLEEVLHTPLRVYFSMRIIF